MLQLVGGSAFPGFYLKREVVTYESPDKLKHIGPFVEVVIYETRQDASISDIGN